MSELKIKVGEKEYLLPTIKAAQYRKVLEADEKRESGEDLTLLSTEGVDAAIQFYFDLLNPHYPKITKKKLLAELDANQLGSIPRALVCMEILRTPLDSELASVEGSKSASETSSKMPTSPSPSPSDGPQEK